MRDKNLRIDLHIHSRNGSDGRWDIEDIFREAHSRSIGCLSITDHDSIAAQEKAFELAAAYDIRYISGIELNITFSHHTYLEGKDITLDFLGYGFNIHDLSLTKRLEELRAYRITRARKIFTKLNNELTRLGLHTLSEEDRDEIFASADCSLTRPHIASHLIRKGLVKDKQEAFDKLLAPCNVPKMPLSIEEASELIRGAGGKLVLAHPGDPKGTSLIPIDSNIATHPKIIRDTMLHLIDGIECWHVRHTRLTAKTYASFVKSRGLIATGGSDCHQQPPIMGSIFVPSWVPGQFA